MNEKNITLDVGAEKTLSASIQPEEASARSIRWSSDNANVAIVDADGNVIGLSAGTATVTAACDYGTDSCVVTVCDSDTHEHDWSKAVQKNYPDRAVMV